MVHPLTDRDVIPSDSPVRWLQAPERQGPHCESGICVRPLRPHFSCLRLGSGAVAEL
jgi:hypothetical protein